MSRVHDPASAEGAATMASPSDIEARDAAQIDRVLGGSGESNTPSSAPDASGATAKQLLAQVAERRHDEPRSAELERHERHFVRWLLGSFAAAVVILLGTLWWLDPISVTGRQTRFSIVENGGVRQAKLDLMEELQAAPDVLFLGSSRTMKLNPAEVERISGATAFNGGVSGGTSQDIYLYARYAEQLWGGEGASDEFPHLVIGVVHDVLRDTGTAALDPRLKQFLPQSQSETGVLEQGKQLLQLKTVEAAARSVRRVTARDGWGAVLQPEEGAGRVDAALATTGRQKGNQRENLDARGMQLFDPGADYTKPLDQRIETQMTTFVQRSYEADPDFSGADPAGVQRLRATIKLANAHGDAPTLWVTPFAPGAEQFLPRDEWRARDERFRDALADMQRDGLEFELVDLADIRSFDGSATEWHDGIHMTEANTARVIAELHRRGVLAPD